MVPVVTVLHLQGCCAAAWVQGVVALACCQTYWHSCGCGQQQQLQAVLHPHQRLEAVLAHQRCLLLLLLPLVLCVLVLLLLLHVVALMYQQAS